MGAVLENVSAYDLFVFEHGYKPATPQLADLFFSLFLHGGFLHLFGNMLFLWIYGDNVEYRLGRLPLSALVRRDGHRGDARSSRCSRSSSAVPLVGASGAISGLLGFYFLWFPRNTVRMFVFLFPFFMNVVAVRARIVLGIYLVVDNLLPFLVSAGGERRRRPRRAHRRVRGRAGRGVGHRSEGGSVGDGQVTTPERRASTRRQRLGRRGHRNG